MSLFVNVIIPLNIASIYTYKVPEYISNVVIGQLVIVDFNNKICYGLIYSISESSPELIEIKEIITVYNSGPLTNSNSILFWGILSNYYMCSIGNLMTVALAIKPYYNPSIEILTTNCINNLNNNEQIVLKELISAYSKKKGKLSMSNVKNAITNRRDLFAILQKLNKLNIIKLINNTSTYNNIDDAAIVLHPQYKNTQAINNVIKNLKSKKSQLHTLETFISLSARKKLVFTHELIQAKCTKKSIDNLLKANVLVTKVFLDYRQNNDTSKMLKPLELSAVQQKALSSVKQAFAENKPALLYGVTSSGKTLIYVNLIKDCLIENKQVLLLVPEINLASQIVYRIQEYFSSNILCCYNSNLKEREKLNIWHKVLNATCKIIIGTRSSIFLPFTNLGLIIVDEEHDSSYKQDNPPYYNAKDSVHFLSQIHKANLLLGSATPSIESYYNTTIKKYTMVKLKERYNNYKQPSITIYDLNTEKNKANHPIDTDIILSKYLIEKIATTLQNKTQAILFQNRRGYAPIIICKNCKSTIKCLACDVSLVFYQSSKQLKCHYCGHCETFTHKCPKCASSNLHLKGKGTEKIEELLNTLFPTANIQRIDTDITKKKSFSDIINQFEDKQIDILVGTQIISKGVDFSNVSLVGIVDADMLINFPDFRAFEQSFQLINQVSGRAGRKGLDSEVVVQSYDAKNQVIKYIKENDYEGFIQSELEIRKLFGYPPFTRIINISIKGKDANLVTRIANTIVDNLNPDIVKDVLGPESPFISYVNYEYSKRILVKSFKKVHALKTCKQHIQDVINKTKREFKIYTNKNIAININVDY